MIYFLFQYLTKSDGNGKIVVIKSYVQNDLLGFSKQQNVRKEINFTIFKLKLSSFYNEITQEELTLQKKTLDHDNFRNNFAVYILTTLYITET